MPRSPRTSPSSGYNQGTSIGSYRGKPLQMSSFRNEEVYKKAKALGDFHSFVGSVDGRTGMDESDSYGTGAVDFTGEPKSFSERFMMEEAEERRRKNRSG